MTFMSIISYAQFTTYEPVIVDRSGNWVNRNESLNSNNYNNYNNENNYNYSIPQRSEQQQQSQILSTRGYYFNNNQWNPVLLRVKVIGENAHNFISLNRKNGISFTPLN